MEDDYKFDINMHGEAFNMALNQHLRQLTTIEHF
jgi:hypothetical protein